MKGIYLGGLSWNFVANLVKICDRNLRFLPYNVFCLHLLVLLSVSILHFYLLLSEIVFKFVFLI